MTMLKYDFSAMADQIERWADEEDLRDARGQVLVMALNLAAGYSETEMRDFVGAVEGNEFEAMFTPMANLYGVPEDVPALRDAFRLILDFDLRASWDNWCDKFDPSRDERTQGLDTFMSRSKPEPPRQS